MTKHQWLIVVAAIRVIIWLVALNSILNASWHASQTMRLAAEYQPTSVIAVDILQAITSFCIAAILDKPLAFALRYLLKSEGL